MTLLIYYVVIQLVLDAIAIAIGLAIEQVSPALSMPLSWCCSSAACGWRGSLPCG